MILSIVEEDDPVLLDHLDRRAHRFVGVEQAVGLLREQHLVGLGDGHAARLGALPERLAEHFAEVDHPDLAAGHAGNVDGRHAGGGALLHVDLDLLVVEVALAQHLAELGPGLVARLLADQRVQHPRLGRQFRRGVDLGAAALLDHADGEFDQVADDLLDVAPDVADLGELGRLDLEEGRLGEAGQTPRDLGLADAGRPDHQDILGQHLVAQLIGQLLAAPAVAQGDGDGALGLVLADDETVEFGDDLARAEGGHRVLRLSRTTVSLV